VIFPQKQNAKIRRIVHTHPALAENGLCLFIAQSAPQLVKG